MLLLFGFLLGMLGAGAGTTGAVPKVHPVEKVRALSANRPA